MIVPAFSQGLYGRLRQLAAADWQRYVAHPFVQQLASGTLAENAFRRYLTQDYLFLIHFARSYALLVSKLRTLPEMRAAAASMNAILNELPLHVGYCAQWGISEPEMAAQPEAPETLNYTRYVLDIGHSMSLSRRWIPSPVRAFRPWRPPCWPVARWCLSPTIRRRPAG